MEDKEYIICSAIWFRDNIEHTHQPVNVKTGFVVCGRRHHNCYFTLSVIGKNLIDSDEETPIRVLINKPDSEREIQGFITNTDRFVDREEGAEIAFNAGQIKHKVNMLMSENLY